MTSHRDPSQATGHRRPRPSVENPYGTTVPEEDVTQQYESPLTRSGKGPYPETERVTQPGDPAVGGVD